MVFGLAQGLNLIAASPRDLSCRLDSDLTFLTIIPDAFATSGIIISTACVIEALIIAWLVVLHLKRSRTEQQVAQPVPTSDVTRQQKHISTANSKETQLEAIIESATDAIVTFNDRQQIVLFNASAEKLFNCSIADAIGRQLDQFIPERFREALKEHIRLFGETNITQRSNALPLDLYGLKATGEEFPIEGSISCAKIGEQRFFTIILRDITDRKVSQLALQTAQEELRQLKDQLEAENIYLQQELQHDQAFGEIIGQSDPIKYVLSKITQVAATDSTVLIQGETGTGKELVARAIHGASSRKDRPLIKVNCAALAATLIESELFGHEKGAFTGAGIRKLGRFELANEGTLFLDEIGDLPLQLQVKLLRVLQEGEFERLGSTRTIKVNVRIIAATNRNLKAEVDKGTFREDLWYRLNVFPITVPPLRQRKEDIPLFVDHFVNKSAKRLGKKITSVSPRTLQALQSHSWPGNVRELANVVERAVINTQGAVLRIADTFEQFQEQLSRPMSLEEMEREYIIRILENTGWRVEGQYGAARILGLNPSTLRARMIRLGIHRPHATTA